ncbi:MAG TPA: histidine phosphatase family protein [Sphingorhabdus sp.]|nr:histidine phosphatase family protein [Sphingorhabdus sp.]
MSTNGKRLFIARHGETVFNSVARMQGQRAVHTPLTRNGFLQADAMGKALAPWFEGHPPPKLWSSTAGRALQTLAIVAEHVGADWHQTRADDRLQEIDVGDWSERTYADIHAEIGPFVDPEFGLFTVRPPNGEWYDEIAHRLSDWLADATAEPGDAIVLMHGISARVLRGILVGLPVEPMFGAPIADSLPQGSMVMIRDGEEQIVTLGEGALERA